MIDTKSDYTRLKTIADSLVDDRVGIIKFLSEVPRESGAPDFYHFFSQACDTSAFTRQKNFGNAGGASINPEKAMAKAVGEAVERYCAAIFEQEECPLSNTDSAPFQCVSPEDFALYNSQQYARTGFPYVPFTNYTKIRWCDAVNPLSGNTWYVPASMVYIPYSPQTDLGEQAIVQPISTGLACHRSWEEAAGSAIAEVIERDAFTITWQAQISPPQISNHTLSLYNQEIIRRFERAGYSVNVFNITLDHGIPTILSVLQHTNTEIPAMVFSASAHLNPEMATQSSLEELAHTRRMAAHLKTNCPPLFQRSITKILVIESSHVHFYCDQTNFSLAQFIFSSDHTIDFSDIPNISTNKPKQDLLVYLEKIQTIHHQVLLRDITTPDINDLGLKVARAVIPGFHPLFMGHAMRGLGGSRLWEVPQKMGYCGIRPETGDNPLAHPYP